MPNKYLSFQTCKLLSKNSMNFLNTSLNNLINNVKNSRYDFPCLKKHRKSIKNDTDLNLLTKKGTCPYKYMNCVEKSMMQNYLNMKTFIQK